MIRIKIEGKNYNIPNNLNELTIKDYQFIKGINIDNKIMYFTKLLGYFGIEEYLVKKIPSREILSIIESITVMLKDVDIKLKHMISIDGVEYIFEKNLDKLRFDQFVDLSQLTENEKLITDNIHLIAAILYRPITEIKKERFKLKHLWCKRNTIYNGEVYDSNKVIERADIFQEKMNMEVIYGMLFFFSLLKLKYIKSTLESSLIEEQKKMKRVIKSKSI